MRHRRKARRKPAPTSDLAHREAKRLERTDHGMSLDQWAAALSRLVPDEYRDRPEGEASLVLARKARVRVYARRVEEGKAVFCDGDLAARTAAAERAREGLLASLTG